MDIDNDEIDYGDLDLDFNYLDEGDQQAIAMEGDQQAIAMEDSEPQYLPPDYLLKNNVAKHKQLAQILAVYYHAKHGEPMNDVFEHLQDTEFETTPIKSIHFYFDSPDSK